MSEVFAELRQGDGRRPHDGARRARSCCSASFLQPFTILLSLPLSIGGAILALVITQKPISLPVVIGILMLMGIVTKNAIMLVDFAVEEIAQGRRRATTRSSTPAASARGRS